MTPSHMKTDYRAWMKYILLMAAGPVSFMIIGDLLEGTLQYSLLKIIGVSLCSIVFLLSMFQTLHYAKKNQVSKKAEWLLLFIPVSLMLLLLAGMGATDVLYETPVTVFGLPGNLLIGTMALFFVIGLSIWAGTSRQP